MRAGAIIGRALCRYRQRATRARERPPGYGRAHTAGTNGCGVEVTGTRPGWCNRRWDREAPPVYLASGPLLRGDDPNQP